MKTFWNAYPEKHMIMKPYNDKTNTAWQSSLLGSSFSQTPYSREHRECNIVDPWCMEGYSWCSLYCGMQHHCSKQEYWPWIMPLVWSTILWWACHHHNSTLYSTSKDRPWILVWTPLLGMIKQPKTHKVDNATWMNSES